MITPLSRWPCLAIQSRQGQAANFGGTVDVMVILFLAFYFALGSKFVVSRWETKRGVGWAVGVVTL